MKKLNKKGFMLTETLIVATLLISVLLILYLQFKNINENFDQSFSYDTVGSSYNLYNAKIFIEQSNYSLIAEKLKTVNYVELTDCPAVYFREKDYCETLFTKLKIKKIIMTNENLYSLIEVNDLGSNFNKYLKTIEYEKKDGYRLIASFSDNTYSSIKILNGYNFDYVISNSCNASVKVNYTINHIYKTSALTGLNIYDSDNGSTLCGASVNVEKYKKNTDQCYYYSGVSSQRIDTSLDSSLNVADIYYSRYDSNLTVYHYLEGTTTEVSTPTVINGLCGSVIDTEQYRKNISGYIFINPDVDQITLTKNDASVILYYRGA